ncbi:MAG: hypothetical protein COW24_00740 [Candidatus Kerfeldbacteria bacterium CG15_BIG_FIL_POST_REV_8_21_14_020_45_12]|uniref:Glycosyltransferase RgtA/B/C/D-like domain-containing protein n=1 Tax=Candidatus Kerfeldbacteria bacterium CG15_BIG_FIL_POST_REV_8_21_14_020_45_12 TaxID=2014247 RepID=A0A2M7H528_9BACT|nr:MAG: hypothetical protein COW24_00740 [Candidatus Kerfeldbacteria bacterium CG15_BIG_FIL_POST_REV_8_21_14_020_45_12]PJA93144.1 MAG: hypothetical protein CO132_04560 [Candidatus Kerfeldbacteria bacterium CG_4_9_14_3_um_filter_45_8]
MVLLLAIFFRFWDLSVVPPGLYNDEAVNGNDAISALEESDYRVYYDTNFGREGLHVAIVSVAFRLFGVGVLQLRSVGALAGVMTVVGLYFLGKEMVGRNVGLLASFFLAVSFWHVMFSRIAYRGILTPLALVWSMFFLMRALKTKSPWHFLVFGVSFGLGMYTYISFRAAVGIVFFVSVAWLVERYRESGAWNVRKWFGREGWWGWLVAFICGGLVTMPLVVYFMQNPAEAVRRAGPISVFAADQPTFALLDSFLKTIGMFNIAGSPLWRHNIADQPMLLFPVGVLFLIGLIVNLHSSWSSLSKVHRVLLYSWLAFMLSPTIFSNENTPHGLRAIGVVPVVYLFAALGAAWLWKFISTHLRLPRWTLIIIAVAFVTLLTGAQAYKYFYVWVRNPNVEYDYIQHHVKLADEIKSSKEQYYIVVDLSGYIIDGYPVSLQSLLFLLHDVPNVQYIYPSQVKTIADGRVVSLEDMEIKAFNRLQADLSESGEGNTNDAD